MAKDLTCDQPTRRCATRRCVAKCVRCIVASHTHAVTLSERGHTAPARGARSARSALRAKCAPCVRHAKSRRDRSGNLQLPAWSPDSAVYRVASLSGNLQVTGKVVCVVARTPRFASRCRADRRNARKRPACERATYTRHLCSHAICLCRQARPLMMQPMPALILQNSVSRNPKP